MIRKFAMAILLLCALPILAQTTVTGTVTDAKSGEPLPGVSIKLVGKALGTSSDFDGNYTLEVRENPPFDVEYSILGYISQITEITENQQKVDIALSETETDLDEVVISASRTPESIRESPVTIERMDVRDIKSTSSVSFYSGLENLKGVDVNQNSLTFNSVNTRGFASFANTRFMQLVDGMDNSSPALNFNVGNMLGMSELDVESVELLPGASSALYGANAFNGILFMTSKSPFDHPGISAYIKTGLTTQEAAGTNSYFDGGVRAAYIFSEKFAAKASFSFLKGTEFFATDYRNTTGLNPVGEDSFIPGDRMSNPDYDGLNIYGDEVSTNIHEVAIALVSAGMLPPGAEALIPDQDVSRTGYEERNLTDYVAESAKVDVAFHYRPFENDFEVVLNGKIGTGNAIYQGANRYMLNDFLLQQYKLEVRNDNFFVRGYYTTESAGDSYDSRFTGININRKWKADNVWFGQYVGAYAQGAQQILMGGGSPSDVAAASSQLHNAARQFADQGRFVPGTDEFSNAFDKVTNDPNLETGSQFKDNTSIFHVDANYNFGHLMDFAEIQVGGSFRQYRLNSFGTIFTDYDGVIPYDEYGAYLQVQKKFADDKLKFTGSARYDKSKNFDGNISPRLSLVFSPDDAQRHNFRASYQTGFRNPTTQDQYIGLNVGRAFLVGSAPDNLDRFTTPQLTVSGTGQSLGIPASITLSGRAAYDNSFTRTSLAQGNPEQADISSVKPEEVTAYELGYRGRIGKVSVDVSGYYNQYKDFISVETVIVPFYGKTDFSDFDPSGPLPAPLALIAVQSGDFQPFQVYTNSKVDVNSYGGAIGLTTRLGKFDLGANYALNRFDFDQAANPDYEAGFNTPEHKVKVSFGSTDLFKNFGFNINYRWQDRFYWQATFADAYLNARSIVDAQINYTVPKIKSTFKLGGTNIGGDEYFSAPGVGAIGSMYYLSWTVNM